MFKNEELAYKNGECATVSIGNWLVLDLVGLLSIIPVVGPIATIVIYIVIAANRQGTPSIQNRIIVNFIWLGIELVIFVVFAALMFAGVVNLGGALEAANSSLPSAGVA